MSACWTERLGDDALVIELDAVDAPSRVETPYERRLRAIRSALSEGGGWRRPR